MTQQISSSKIITHPPQKVRVGQIESELDGLWSQFNKHISAGQTVMRACMSNLIIYCDTREEAKVISEELLEIVAVHPLRVLLLIGKEQPGKDELEAYISIYYMSVPDGLQVCAEKIDVLSAPEMAGRLPSVVRSQLIGDLPTALWWASRQPPPDAGEVFFELAELANQIIYDNMGWANPTKAVATMTRWVAAQQDERVVYNLAWRRSAIWRRLISQVLDPQVAPGALTSLRLIEIDHGPDALAITWLLVSWMACQLQWRPTAGRTVSNKEMVWKFRNNNHEIKVIAHRLPKGDPLLYRLSFKWSQAGKEGHTCFQRMDLERIEITETNPETSRAFTFQKTRRAALVAAQLAHRDRDKIFENALVIANKMAEHFQK